MIKLGMPGVALLIMTGCGILEPAKAPEPAKPVEAPSVAAAPPPPPTVIRDPQLEQRLAHAELMLLEKEAQVSALQTRLDDARREVVRAMAKMQSLATRAEAASGIAEAEIAVEALRASAPAAAPEVTLLMKQSTAEFDRKNYAGALYLASQAKGAAIAARGQLASDERGAPRQGEVPFTVPLRLQTTARANVREGPGSSFKVNFTLPANAELTGHSFAQQWVRVTDADGRRGWIYQGLIGRRP